MDERDEQSNKRYNGRHTNESHNQFDDSDDETDELDTEAVDLERDEILVHDKIVEFSKHVKRLLFHPLDIYSFVAFINRL